MFKKTTALLLIGFFSCSLINAQLKKYTSPNFFSEAEIYKDEKGQTYSTVISIKFDSKTIDLKRGEKFANLTDVLITDVKEILLSIGEKFGAFRIEKEFVNSQWGDTIATHIRSKKPVIIKDLSQYFKLKFEKIICVDTIVAELKQSNYISFASGPFYAFYAYQPNDYSANEQWALPKVEAVKAWDITKGSNQIKIAFVDGWRYYDDPASNLHTELRNGKVVYNPWDVSGGHGQQTSGVAAALTDNGSGIASLGFNTSLMYLLGSPAGISAAVQNGAHIINCSWIDFDWPQLNQAIYNALNQGVLVVAAIGND